MMYAKSAHITLVKRKFTRVEEGFLVYGDVGPLGGHPNGIQ